MRRGPLLAPVAVVLASSAAPAAPKAEPLPPEGANLFVYRADAQPDRLGVWLWVDLKQVATIRHKRWTALKLFPGPHIIRLHWPKGLGQTDYERVVTLEEGRTYYFGIVGRTGWGSDLVRGAEDQMRACCRYTPAK